MKCPNDTAIMLPHQDVVVSGSVLRIFSASSACIATGVTEFVRPTQAHIQDVTYSPQHLSSQLPMAVE